MEQRNMPHENDVQPHGRPARTIHIEGIAFAYLQALEHGLVCAVVFIDSEGDIEC